MINKIALIRGLIEFLGIQSHILTLTKIELHK